MHATNTEGNYNIIFCALSVELLSNLLCAKSISNSWDHVVTAVIITKFIENGIGLWLRVRSLKNGFAMHANVYIYAFQ